MISELYLLGAAGAVLHYGKKYETDRIRGQKQKLIKRLPTLILSLLTTSLLVYIRDDFNDIYPMTKATAIALGYVGNSAFFTFLTTKEKQFQNAFQKPIDIGQHGDGDK
jgi:hypothetical protein